VKAPSVCIFRSLVSVNILLPLSKYRHPQIFSHPAKKKGFSPKKYRQKSRQFLQAPTIASDSAQKKTPAFAGGSVVFVSATDSRRT
jgi:hypothetical protein